MIVALNSNLERTLITNRDTLDSTYFCQLCGSPVYVSSISESRKPKQWKSRKRTTQNLDKYIKFDLELPIFVHHRRPCERTMERETIEHITMKLLIAQALISLQPIIDHPLGKHLVDIYLPNHNVAIECQSSQASGENIRRVVYSNTQHDASTLFIWGSRVFARLMEGDNSKHVRLLATVAEHAIISHFSIGGDSSGSMREAVAESNNSIERHYVYYKDRQIQWMHLFRNKDRLYLGTQHPFTITNLSLRQQNTEIGSIALLCSSPHMARIDKF